MVMVVHMYIGFVQMPNQLKGDGSLPFFVLLMITTQVLHSGPLEQGAPRDILRDKLIQSHYHIAPNLPLSQDVKPNQF